MSLLASAARAYGRAIGRYGRRVVAGSHLYVEGDAFRSAEPVIFAAWHGTGLIGLAVYGRLRERPCYDFIPGGLVGVTLAAWLEASGIRAVSLGGRRPGTPVKALRAMASALEGGADMVIAVDGPHGPAKRVRPGACWLARHTGAAIVPSGIAAHPAVRVPRWDRHLVPLPGARIAMVFGNGLRVPDDVSQEDCLAALEHALQTCTARAWSLLTERTSAPQRVPTDDARTV
jgi:lysophospholipid acyltransferase (LPLAT)-like uncharacterized protein